MAMIGVDIVVGKTLEHLYDDVEKLISRNLMFESLCKDTKSKLDTLKPLIQEMVQCNQRLNQPDTKLEPLEALIKGGLELVSKCSKIRLWNIYKKYKYTSKFLELNESLQKQLDALNVQVASDVKKILEVIGRLDPMNQNQQLPELPEFVVGLDVPLKDLKSKLLEDDEVSMLVLTAPGGCGKTTLATMFCQDEEVKDKFKNNIIFIPVSKNPNLDQIVQQLYGRNSSSAPRNKENAIESWASWRRLWNKNQDPLLLVFDDVWSGYRSEFILDKFVQLKMSNYKILVTSRFELLRFGSPYRLPLLEFDNAMKLFHHSASLGDKSSHIPKDLARKVVVRCKGFPLGITVVGRSLYGQPIEIWINRERKWSSILDFETGLFFDLRTSLDVLDEEMMECFLDLASFPEGRKIPVTALVDMWEELYDLHEDTDTWCMGNLYELSNRSLVNILDRRSIKRERLPRDTFYGHHFVIQHDILRELAIYHSKQVPVEDRKRMIIDSSGDNLIPKWWREQKHQTIKARLLSITTDQNFSANWPSMQLPEVEVLVLNLQKNGKCDLPEFVEKMDKLKSLQNISLCKCGINGGAFSNMVDAFPNMQEMNLVHCNGFKELPVKLCDLVHLKKLSITNCKGLFRLPKRIGKLENLELLRLRACYGLLNLPRSIRNLKNLKIFDICDCYRIAALPEYIGEMKSLKKFDIRYCLSLKMLT
ncbi:probable disease resistance protein At5g66900 [Rosa rugosa]|uniref:probable disease resistance protein At5g66900 n=1 Tax=Rosa rugosa TaxID=74645 RepID=UPI002B41467C|nr:probable disease resistance protein At5g66900 [Rosa rugosa]